MNGNTCKHLMEGNRMNYYFTGWLIIGMLWLAYCAGPN
jgi:hypothetical protein